MKVQVIIEKLRKITGKKISYTDIGNAIGTTRANVSYLVKKESELPEDKIQKIEQYFHVSLTNDKEKEVPQEIKDLFHQFYVSGDVIYLEKIKNIVESKIIDTKLKND